MTTGEFRAEAAEALVPAAAWTTWMRGRYAVTRWHHLSVSRPGLGDAETDSPKQMGRRLATVRMDA